MNASTRAYHKANCDKVKTEQRQEDQPRPGRGQAIWWYRCTQCGFTFSDRDADAISLCLMAIVGGAS